MWYSSFWSEEPKNHQNLKILVSKFVPRGFEAQQTWGFEAQQHGVSRGGGGVSRHSNMGFRGAATWDLEAQQQVGWDLKGQQRDLEAQQHGTGLSRGYFFIFHCNRFETFVSLVKNFVVPPKQCRQTVTFSIRMERC